MATGRSNVVRPGGRWAVVAGAVLLAGVTLVVATPPEGHDYAAWPAGLRGIARGLSFPILQEPGHEIRRFIFLAVVGTACFASGAAAILVGRRGDVAAGGLPWGIIGCAAVVLLCGTISTLSNRTGWMSFGWMVQFLAGVAWAAWLASELDGVGCDRLCTVASGLLVMTVGLTLWQQHWSRVTQIDWPIGSVTAAGYVAAICTAWFGPVVLGDVIRGRSAGGAAIVRAAGLVSAVVLLVVARRYGAIIAAGFGLTASAAMWLWHAKGRGWRRVVAGTIVGVFVVAAVGATWFLSTERTLRRGSILTRLGLYQATLHAIAERPLLGFGPDSYAARATTRLARLRSESPQVYHGQMAEAGHNEWLQAILSSTVGSEAWNSRDLKSRPH